VSRKVSLVNYGGRGEMVFLPRQALKPVFLHVKQNEGRSPLDFSPHTMCMKE